MSASGQHYLIRSSMGNGRQASVRNPLSLALSHLRKNCRLVFSGILLDTFGYVANQEQTPQALFGLKIMISVIPFMAAVTCLILILNYRLDQSRHREIVRDIERRQSNTDTQ